MRYVDGLDPQGRLGKPQRCLQLHQGQASGGQVTRSTGLMQRKALFGICRGRGQKIPLGTPDGDPDINTRTSPPRQPINNIARRRERRQHQWGALPCLLDQGNQQAPQEVALIRVIHSLNDIAALAPYPPLTHMKDLKSRFQVIHHAADDVRVDGFVEDDGVPLQRPMQGTEIISTAGGTLVVQ